MQDLIDSKTKSRSIWLSLGMILLAAIVITIFTKLSPAATLPRADLNGDKVVNIADLSILLSHYQTTDITSDINQDGAVNILDLSILLSNYGGTLVYANWNCSWGTYDGSALRWPTSCWRPYDDNAWLNRELPSNPRLLPNSSAMVAKMLSASNDPIADSTISPDTNDDYSHPFYFSKSSDPLFTVHCWRYPCPSIEGLQVRIPAQAKPAGDADYSNGGDMHMTVVDQTSNWVWDFYKTETYGDLNGPVLGDRLRATTPGTIWIGSGGRNMINGDARGVTGDGSNAAKTGLLAGPIRAEELEAGIIPHKLFMVVKCTAMGYVYPAQGNASTCPDTTNAPSDGQVFYLDMTDTEINALSAPTWRKTILKAMAHYGMYVGDTGGSSAFGVQMISDSTYTAYGQEGAMQKFARMHQSEGGITASGSTPGKWYMDLTQPGLDWFAKLNAVDACVIQNSC